MAEDKRPEVNLEVCSGFFRIPTNDIIYNIKVLDSQNESSTTRVVERIVEVEKAAAKTEAKPVPPPEPAPPSPSAPPETHPADNYYQQAVVKFSADLRQYKDPDLDSGQGDTTINGLNDLAAMANELREVLDRVKGHQPMSATPAGGGKGMAASLKPLRDKIAQAIKLTGSPADETTASEPEAAPAPAAAGKMTRYLFNFDAVFQTIYELCTNETVKEHVQKARVKADEIFSKDKFYDAISPKAATLEEDDGFLSVPLTDILKSLASACSDKGTINLLKKMAQQQADIFLDQFLPLEVPPTEEVEIPGDTAESSSAPLKEGEATQSPSSAAGGDLAALLSEIQAELASLDNSTTQNTEVPDAESDEVDFSGGIDDAISIAANINYDAEQMAKAADIETRLRWLPVGAISVFIDNLLSQKEENPTLTFDEGVQEAQAAAEEFRSRETAELEAALAPEEEPPVDDDSGGSGEASQDEIDRLLEEMG